MVWAGKDLKDDLVSPPAMDGLGHLQGLGQSQLLCAACVRASPP